MKGTSFRYYGATILIILVVMIFPRSLISAQTNSPSQSITAFTVKTYDGLELPAQVIESTKSSNTMLLFINGSTPYDEKGNQWAGWDDTGKLIKFKHDFYIRFLDIMILKGYNIATMAKRSFVYSHKIPRPSLDELALDIQSLVLELKKRELLRSEDDLVVVGYSEGSIVATKVLGLMKKQPDGCILLGSGSLAYNYKTQSWREWFMTDVIRKQKGWTDDQLKTEYEQFSKIQTDLLTIDEDKFENEYKKSNPSGFGFAPWESYHIDKEVPFYDPVPNLLASNIPILICIGDNDSAMPIVLALRTYESLLENGYQKATFRVIEDEVHQYNKYDVFAIIDTWIDSGGESTDFVLNSVDERFIAKYALIKEISSSISSLSDEGGEKEKALACFRKAKEANFQELYLWFQLGLKLFANGSYEESLYSFSQAIDPSFIICYASMVWIGHINDLLNNREEAVSWYKKALENYPGFPVQHDQWGMKLDKKWIEERLETPFTGIR